MENVVTFKSKRVMSADDITPRQLKIGLEATEFVNHCIAENETFLRSYAEQAILQVGEDSFVWYAQANARDMQMALEYRHQLVVSENEFSAAIDKYIADHFS